MGELGGPADHRQPGVAQEPLARVVIEEGAWIGPNSCSIEDVTIGKGSFVGIGSTVTKSIPAGAVFAGSPAEPIEDLKNARKVLKELVAQQRAP